MKLFVILRLYVLRKMYKSKSVLNLNKTLSNGLLFYKPRIINRKKYVKIL